MSESKKPKKSRKPKKYILYDLVRSCELRPPLITLRLAEAGLLEQYQQEVEKYKVGEVKASITKEEFDKIMKGSE